MKNLSLFFLILTYYVNAQEIIYYNKLDKKTSKDSAFFYRSIKKINEIDHEVTDYYMSGEKKMEGHFRYMEPEYRQGKFTYYYEDGKVSATRTFFSQEHGTSTYFYPNGNRKLTKKYYEGKEIDSLKSYYETGELKRIQYHDASDPKGKTIIGKVYTKTGKDTIFYAYDEKPAYKGTQKEYDDYAYRHLITPKAAKKDGFRGKVIILCIVTENGLLEDAKVLKTTHDFLNENALDFIKKIPAWNPARTDGVIRKGTALLELNFSFR